MLIRTKLLEIEADRDGFYIGVGQDDGGGRKTAVFFNFTGSGLWAVDWRGRQIAGPARWRSGERT